MGLIEPDTAKAIKAMEFVRDSAGEKPAEKTDVSIMADKASGVDLLTKALLEDDDEDDDE